MSTRNRPIVILSQVHNWEGDPNVQERLVYFSREQFEKHHSIGAVQASTFKLRAIKTERNWEGVVRNSQSKEIIYTTNFKKSLPAALFRDLEDIFFTGWDIEYRDLPSISIPDKKS